MAAFLWIAKNPLLVLLIVMGILCAGLFTTAYVQGTRLDAAKARLAAVNEQLKAEKERADRLQKERENLDKVLVEMKRDREAEAASAAKRTVIIDKHRGGPADPQISPLMREYLESLRGEP